MLRIGVHVASELPRDISIRIDTDQQGVNSTPSPCHRAMRARKPERVVAVALANKLARIAGESFRTELYTKA